MRILRSSLVGILSVCLLGAITAPVASQGASPPAMDPARFTMDIVEPPVEQPDGSSVATVEASDPRISGTWTEVVEIVEMGGPQGAGEPFMVWSGSVRIDNTDGAWVGPTQGFWSESFADGQTLLAGEGGYEGLTAILYAAVGNHDYQGVLYPTANGPRPPGKADSSETREPDAS